MKTILAVLITNLAFAQLYAQIQVGVWTNKTSYLPGDTVALTITVYNPSADTVVLHFGSSCQVSYTIDDFNFINHIACAAIVTSRTILPFSSVQWDFLKYPGFILGLPQLLPGAHSVTGEVLGYARSDTLLIFVTPTASVVRGTAKNNSFLLNQNYPNPFNGTTVIPFSMSEGGTVTIKVYNNLGQLVHTLLDDYRSAGSYNIQARFDDLPSGSYWGRLQIGARAQTIKLILSK